MADYVLQSTWEDVDAAAQAVANGLQKSQLSQSVQTSLDHADSAYQSHFWVNITRSNNVYSSDKTLSEIQAAYAAGKYVRANLPDGFQSDFTNNDSGAMFYAFDDSGGSMVLMRYTVGASSVVFQSWPVGQQDSFTEEFKTVLLDIAAHVAWDDANGQSRYDALEAALYPETHLVSITASYDQDHPIYDTDSLEAVITTINYDLTVVANYSDGTTETLSSSDYAISGTVEVGASVPFTVTYEGKTDTINVLILESGALPTGYTKKDYIKFNANAGTNIGGRNDNNAILIDDISLSAEYTYEFELKVPSNASSSASPLFGARTGGTGEKLFALFYTPSTTKLGYWINGTDSTTTITGVSTSAVNTIKIKPVGASTTYPDNVVIELNGTEYNTGSTSTATLTSYLAFFKYAISSTQVASWDRYYYGEQYGKFVVKNGSTTVYNFVPAYNGTYYGYYETVNSKWYPGIGSPEKILGGDWS